MNWSRTGADMLTVRRDARGFLEVKEETLGFINAKVAYWYYDTERWLSSAFGQQGELPYFPMAQGQIDWVKTYFLPQLEKQHVDTSS